MQTGNPWQQMKAKYGFEGSIRALEVTYGPNGFHPHIHVVLLLRHLSPEEAAELQDWLAARWISVVTRAIGERHAPSAEHGIDLRPCSKADYLTKLGLELAASTLKAGRGPNRTAFEVAADYVRYGDDKDLAIWRAYADGMFGAKMLTWTRGLRAACGLEPEKTDEEVVRGEDGVEIPIATIPGALWRAIRDLPGVKLQILKAAEHRGREGVIAILETRRPSSPDPGVQSARSRVLGGPPSHGLSRGPRPA